MATFNVPVLGNVSVEADSEADALARVEKAMSLNMHDASTNEVAIEIWISIECDNTGVSQID